MTIQMTTEFEDALSRIAAGRNVLIARDVASTSRKAKKVREFGKPIIAQSQFEDWWHHGPFLDTKA
ncbi:hypothetical protein [Actinobaculum suis]|uniref:hypothetical protein n=1 Tax=Actinobaculum suis TaxID=1657 RepID=UPI00080A4B2F|nr:hypothetical protein [Actinobaculum suis]OCA94837.1 hypothetical protein ACU20_05550 [Actinobaculum suis]